MYKCYCLQYKYFKKKSTIRGENAIMRLKKGENGTVSI